MKIFLGVLDMEPSFSSCSIYRIHVLASHVAIHSTGSIIVAIHSTGSSMLRAHIHLATIYYVLVNLSYGIRVNLVAAAAAV